MGEQCIHNAEVTGSSPVSGKFLLIKMFCPASFIYFTFIFLFLFTLLLFAFTKLYSNLLKLLFAIELLSLNFCMMLLFSDYFFGWQKIIFLKGDSGVLVLFILTIGALEASVGLALIYMFNKQTQFNNIESLNRNKN